MVKVLGGCHDSYLSGRQQLNSPYCYLFSICRHHQQSQNYPRCLCFAASCSVFSKSACTLGGKQSCSVIHLGLFGELCAGRATPVWGGAGKYQHLELPCTRVIDGWCTRCFPDGSRVFSSRGMVHVHRRVHLSSLEFTKQFAISLTFFISFPLR